MIRVLLVDDQALIRSGIRALLEAEDDLEVVPSYCQDPRQPGHDQARRPRPSSARRVRLPDRARQPSRSSHRRPASGPLAPWQPAAKPSSWRLARKSEVTNGAGP